MIALRLGLGLLWSLNLIYIFDPANQYWSSFAVTARTFESTSVGGGSLASFVANHAPLFAAAIAAVTAYLAVAFLLGMTCRAACVIGGAFNLALLVTQFGQISTFPGATDVGAQPLYLAMYVALLLGYDPSRLAVDRAIRLAFGNRRTRGLPGAAGVREGARRHGAVPRPPG